MSSTWRESAACLHEDPELFFPFGGEHAHVQNAEAKAVCQRCPVARECLRFALAENIPVGIYGGLTEKERAALRREIRRRQLDPNAIAVKAAKAQKASTPRTLKSIVAANTRPLQGGHLGWTGGLQTHFQGQVYTPKQVAFAALYGRRSKERLRAGCGIDACVLAEHLIEVPAVAKCGTRGGYAKHLREKTTPCTPCRRACCEAEALRRTGTTKVPT